MLRNCWQRQRGALIIQLAIVLPVILMLVYGSFEVWRVMQVRDSLEEGVFQAVLYFSTYGYEEGAETLRQEAWNVAQEIIAENIRGSGVVDSDDLARLELRIEYDPMQMGCEDLFTVEAMLPLNLSFAPLARALTLRERQVGYYQCEPPPYVIQILWPPDGYTGGLGEVRITSQCYTSPIMIQVAVMSNGSLHYQSPWLSATCGNAFTHVFPPVPSGPWKISVCGRGGRSGLRVCAGTVTGSYP